MHSVAKLGVIALFGLACGACSNSDHGAPASSAPAPASTPVAPPASAIPMQAPPASGASTALPELSPPATAPSFAVIMRRPAFAHAFAVMDGAAALPAWAKTGGTTPSTRVQVDGAPMWLSRVCASADCRGSQLFLLTDPSDHTMRGLFVDASGSAGASVHKLTWLGKPDAAAQTFLAGQATPD